jgi:pantoate--beta-alanine ligase
MGQKDYQQQRIVRALVHQLHIPTKVVTVATEREPDGLAMSSRNMLLEPRIRSQAVCLYEQLVHAKRQLEAGVPPTAIEAQAMDALAQPDFRPEYFSIVDGNTLQPVLQPHQHLLIVACTAVWAGNVRLIDNLILKGKL